MQRHALEVNKTWREVARIAEVDFQSHKFEVSYMTNEIVVREIEEGEENE